MSVFQNPLKSRVSSQIFIIIPALDLSPVPDFSSLYSWACSVPVPACSFYFPLTWEPLGQSSGFDFQQIWIQILFFSLIGELEPAHLPAEPWIPGLWQKDSTYILKETKMVWDAGEGGHSTHSPGSLCLWRSSHRPKAHFVLGLSSSKERPTVGSATGTDC